MLFKERFIGSSGKDSYIKSEVLEYAKILWTFKHICLQLIQVEMSWLIWQRFKQGICWFVETYKFSGYANNLWTFVNIYLRLIQV